MIDEGYRCWDECPGADTCELILSFMQLVDPDKEWITALDILSDLDMPHYDSLAYQEYIVRYYDGCDPTSFKTYIDSMTKLAKGIDDGNY